MYRKNNYKQYDQTRHMMPVKNLDATKSRERSQLIFSPITANQINNNADEENLDVIKKKRNNNSKTDRFDVKIVNSQSDPV